MTVKDIHILFKKYHKTLTSVESFTGGLFASEMTSVGGASAFFKGGMVTYYTEEKIRLLGVSKEIIHDKGVVSCECAYEMASKGREKMDSDICISFTGNAGPSAMENKEVGEIYIGIAKDKLCRVYKYQLKGDRDQIRKKAVELSYSLLEKFLCNN